MDIQKSQLTMILINMYSLNKFNFNMENQENWKETDYSFEEQLESIVLLTHSKTEKK